MTSRVLKHLPEPMWPPDDLLLFEAAYAGGDIFDDTAGPGAHFSTGTRKSLCYAWRRWLGFLAKHHPGDLYMEAADRIRPDRLRDYIDHLSQEVAPSSVADYVAHLYDCARILLPQRDWGWLRALKSRLQARACPEDRFERLVPGEHTLDYGIELMEEALAASHDPWMRREIRFRDDLILALLSLWPIRRRSLAALTESRHLRLKLDTAELRLFPEDTKAKRAEDWPVPDLLRPYMDRYIQEIRPRLLGKASHDALWVGQHGDPLLDSGLYLAITNRTKEKFGLPMALHDFRRAAATFLAMQSPELVGLTPGILQHASPDVGDRHYNLARSMQASRRHTGTVSAIKAQLRAKRPILEQTD